MFKFSKLSWTIFFSFALSLLCIMFNCLWTPMIYPALVFMGAGFGILGVKFIINTNLKVKEQEFIREELLMELSVTDEGEQYILKNGRKTKKYRRQVRLQKFNSYLPALFCFIVVAVVIFLFVKSTIGF